MTDTTTRESEPSPAMATPARIVGTTLHVWERLWAWQVASENRGVNYAHPGEDRPRPFAYADQKYIGTTIGKKPRTIRWHIQKLRNAGVIAVLNQDDFPALKRRIEDLVSAGNIQHKPVSGGNAYFVLLTPKRYHDIGSPWSTLTELREQLERAPAEPEQPSLFDADHRQETAYELRKNQRQESAYDHRQEIAYGFGSHPLEGFKQQPHPRAEEDVVVKPKIAIPDPNSVALNELLAVGVHHGNAARLAARCDFGLVRAAIAWWRTLENVGPGYLVRILQNPEQHGFTKVGGIWHAPGAAKSKVRTDAEILAENEKRRYKLPL